MNISLINADYLALLSRMAGQELRQKDATPPVVFMASLLCVVMGVVYQDGTITAQERERWQININRLVPANSDFRKLVSIFTKHLLFFKLYNQFNNLLLLTSPLSDSEKVLLIGFGYQMSASDGEIELKEKQYLEDLADKINIDYRHIQTFELAFTEQLIEDQDALAEVHNLLDPAQFQSLDNIFVLAAKNILESLPAKPRLKRGKIRVLPNYENLKRVQEYRQNLDNICNHFYQIIAQDDHQVWSKSLINELQEISNKNQSKRFRLTVVGEFSQGKSTFLNALVGEEIQPVREIPCSGVVTILRYGKQKRVICCYKDGHKEPIPIEAYQAKASISEEAAIGNLSDELADCEIDQIIFTHPELDICSSGIEIIDSPGLNEHPDREAITQKILKDTDAAIFITSASRPFTKWERDIIEELRIMLNEGLSDQPANNLFVLVNFWDLVQTENGRHQITKRIENIVQGQNPIISGENRIHYISAKLALDAIVNNESNEYIETFDHFINCLQDFLVNERGKIEVTSTVSRIKVLSEIAKDDLKQFESILDGKIKISESEKLNILEKMGEASGRDLKIRNLVNKSQQKAFNEVNQSWKQWLETLSNTLEEKSKYWQSEYYLISRRGREKLIKDYANQFKADLETELYQWINTQFKLKIVEPILIELDQSIRLDLKAVKADLLKINPLIDLEDNQDSNFNKQLIGNQEKIENLKNFGLVGLGAAITPFSDSLSPTVREALKNLLKGTRFGELFDLDSPDEPKFSAKKLFKKGGVGELFDLDSLVEHKFSAKKLLHSTVKLKISETGYQCFVQSSEDIIRKILEIIQSAFSARLENSRLIITQVIESYENLIEQSEKAHQETLEEREIEKLWINQQRQKLETIQNELEAIVSQVAS